MVALLVEGIVELLLRAEHGALGGGDGILGVAALELQAARVLLVALAYAHLGLGVGADDLGDGVVVVEADEQIAAFTWSLRLTAMSTMRPPTSAVTRTSPLLGSTRPVAEAAHVGCMAAAVV